MYIYIYMYIYYNIYIYIYVVAFRQAAFPPLSPQWYPPFGHPPSPRWNSLGFELACGMVGRFGLFNGGACDHLPSCGTAGVFELPSLVALPRPLARTGALCTGSQGSRPVYLGGGYAGGRTERSSHNHLFIYIYIYIYLCVYTYPSIYILFVTYFFS